MAQLLPNVYQQFLDSNGAPLAGGKLYSYAAGTTTPLATYTDEGGGTPNANPTILDANGVASVWLGDSAYKLVLKDSNDVQIWSVDNVSFINDSGVITAKIANSAVTTAKIADGAVTTAKIADANVTTAKIADLNVTTGKINDAAVTFGKIDPALDFSQFTNAVECVTRNFGDFDKGGGYKVIPQWPWSAPVDESSLADALPAASVQDITWSSSGEYVALVHDYDASSTPYLNIYKKEGNSFLSLTPPSFDSGGDPLSDILRVDLSKSGDMFAITFADSPYFNAYQRIGSEFFQLSNPGTTPTGLARACEWSPNGEFLAVGHSSSPYVSIYKRSSTSLGGSLTGSVTGAMADIANVAISGGASSPSADSINAAVNTAIASSNLENKELQSWINKRPPLATLTKVTNPANLPPGAVTGVSWSPDGRYLACVSLISGYLTVYKRSGSTFTKISDPATLPDSACGAIEWSPSGNFLAIGSLSTPYIHIYSFANDTLTKLSDPATLPAGTVNALSWSPNGKLLAVAHALSPYITIYSRSGSTFTKLTNPTTLPTDAGNACHWSPNGKFLMVGYASSPYLTIYQTASTLPTNALLYLSEVPDV